MIEKMEGNTGATIIMETKTQTEPCFKHASSLAETSNSRLLKDYVKTILCANAVPTSKKPSQNISLLRNV